MNSSTASSRILYALQRRRGLDPAAQEEDKVNKIGEMFSRQVGMISSDFSETVQEVASLANELLDDVAVIDPYQPSREQLDLLKKNMATLEEKQKLLVNELDKADGDLKRQNEIKKGLLKNLSELREERTKLEQEKIKRDKRFAKIMETLASMEPS